MRWKIRAATVISVFFLLLSGCGDSFFDLDRTHQQQAVKAAYNLAKEIFESCPDHFVIVNYEMDALDDFKFVRSEGDTYVIRGVYKFTYGFNQQQPVLEVTVKTDFFMKQSEEGKWSIKDIRPLKIESNGEKKRDGWTNSIDDSNCVPFISNRDAEERGLDITQIAQDLVYKLMLELTNYNGEKETFMLLHSQSPENSLEKIEVPSGKDADAVWRFRKNITGCYVGYIKGLGYSGSLLQSNFNLEEESLNLEALYLVKKTEGYFLETSGVFSGRVKGQIVKLQENNFISVT